MKIRKPKAEKAVKVDVVAVVEETVVKKTSGNVIPEQYRKEYGKAANCGDELANALADAKTAGIPLADIADANGVDLARWLGRNVGMIRMNMGNVLRGMHRNGKDVTIAGIVIKGATKAA